MIFYLLALIPVAVWAVQWYFNKEVVWKEAAIGVAVALLTATIFQVIGDSSLMVPHDIQTYSDKVYHAQYQPRWKEYYEEAIYRTEFYSCGTSKNPQTCSRRVFSHWSSRSRWHNERWWVSSGFGIDAVTSSRYNDVRVEFGGDLEKLKGKRKTTEHNSRMTEGDPYDYRTLNETGYIYPMTQNGSFENRLMHATTLYNFEEVTEEQRKGLFKWPENISVFDTDRLMGSASELWNRREWDQMNAVLGPTKKVNIIAVGFPNGSSQETGVLQERLWSGGKKNDLVLTFGGDPAQPSWAYVFGWTEREVVKRLLENRLMAGNCTVAQVQQVIVDEYELLNFEEKFEHVEVPMPWWYYLIFFIVMLGSQGIAHYAFTNNYISKR